MLSRIASKLNQTKAFLAGEYARIEGAPAAISNDQGW
jgi:hypothetical protein